MLKLNIKLFSYFNIIIFLIYEIMNSIYEWEYSVKEKLHDNIWKSASIGKDIDLWFISLILMSLYKVAK